MGAAGSGRTITANRQTDHLAERLDEVRFELRDLLDDERQAEVAALHTKNLVLRCQKRTRRAVAEITLLEQKLGVSGLVVEPVDSETVRIDGVTVRLPERQRGNSAPINDLAAVKRTVEPGECVQMERPARTT